jgi:Zinc carboxypeptidase
MTRMFHFVRPAALCLLACAAAVSSNLHADAAITLDANFDHGSLKSYSTSGSTVNLVGRDNYYGGGKWRWVYFKASGVNGQTPDFKISTNFAGGSSAIANHNFRYSLDNENWLPFDNSGISGGTFNFSNNTPFNQNDVWVAHSIPYSYGRAASQVAQYKLSPYVSPTISSNANLVIGQSPGGTDDLGRTIAPRDLWGFKLTDNSVPSAGKTQIVLTSGLHANEVLGNRTLEGTLDFLLSNDPRAAELRKTAEFFIYPMLNPDGRFAGNNRATIANPNTDPNRAWSPTIPGKTWFGEPEIQLSGEAMMADLEVATGGTAEYFIDYHSTITTSANANDFMFLHPEKGHTADPFWTNFLGETSTVSWVQSTSTGPTTANFGEIELGAGFDATFETAFHPTRGVDYYMELGKDVGVAFFKALARINADIDADGFVGISDLNFLLSRWNQAVPVGNWDFGDIAGNGDGFIGIDDLNQVLAQWNAGTPPPPPGNGATVPEPATLALLTLGALTTLRRPRG